LTRTFDPVGLTARWVAASRARETLRPDSLLQDPLAELLAGEDGFALMARMETSAGDSAPFTIIRARFFDDFLKKAIETTGISQVVALGTGMDTRAFRFPWLGGIRFFEVDRAGLVGTKERLLKQAGAVPVCDRRVVEADLLNDWRTSLSRSGFEAEVPAVWLIEGLLPYFSEADVQHLLTELRTIASPGSHLGVDFVNAEMLISPYTRRWVKALEAIGASWRFGVNDPAAFLAKFGWIATVLEPAEVEGGYGRWPYPRVPRAVPGIPRSFLVTAHRYE
jgi:methyltransferase (TIGR00027 family)